MVIKRFIILFVLTFINFPNYGQNIIPNGDFELYSSCPQSTNGVNFLLNWFNPTRATPDYFNTCATGFANGVPTNVFGHQYAHSGNGYCGLILWHGAPNFREYIEVELTDSLVAGVCYELKLYASLADESMYTTDELGFLFSDTMILYPAITTNIPLTSYIQPNTGNLFNSWQWTEVKYQYNAVGGEKYLVLGNFRRDFNFNIQPYNYSVPIYQLHCYVDNITLEQCQKTSLEIKPSEIKPVEVNISSSILYINLKKREEYKIRILTPLGRIVYEASANTSVELSLSDFSNGTYIYHILGENGFSSVGKFILIR